MSESPYDMKEGRITGNENTSNGTRSLPESWQWVRLGDVIADAQSGFACGERDPKGVVQLRMNNVNTRGRIAWNEFIRVPSDAINLEQFRLIAGDVVFNNTNSVELVGKSALFHGHVEPVVYSNHFTRLRTKRDRLEPTFLAYWLLGQWQSGTFQKLCNRWVGQSAVKNDKLLRMEMPLPALQEQRRIAGILSKQTETVERARAGTEAQLEAAKALPSAYLHAVFNSPQAQTWRRLMLGEVCGFVGGMQPPKSEFKNVPTPGYVRLVQIQDFRRSNVAVYIPVELASRIFDETDVMIGRYGPPVFKILRGLSGAYNVALMKTVPKPGLSKDFLYYLLQEPNIQHSVISYSQRSAGQSGLQKDFLEKMLVPVPPVDEQIRITKLLSQQAESVNGLVKHLETQYSALKDLPQAFLRGAFSGEL